MGRLITLKLQPISQPVKHPTLPPPSNPPPPIPVKSPRRTKSKMSTLLTLPRTEKQWRIVLDEVRNTYLRRQYKQCSFRCIQLLEDASGMVLALHCIYLSFYAAICLELLARPLPISSSQKLSLFNLARVYYQKAEHCMWEVEFGHAITNTELMGRTSPEIHQRFPSSSSDSSGTSHRPSVTSATDSPRSYTSSPPMYSPASSVCSYFSKSEDESCNPLKAKPLRVKKTVSFHPGRPETIPIEPIDTYTSPITSKTLQFRPPNPSLRPVICYTITTPQIDAIASDTMPSFLIFRSIDRYNTHFATIRTQLTHHLSTTAELILSIENAQHLSPKIKINQSYGTNEKGNLPTMFDSYKYALPDIMESGQEEKARQRKARIAELKQRGVDWKLGRGRFDGSRYERLCQEALKELQV